jgi:hypothetical protein
MITRPLSNNVQFRSKNYHGNKIILPGRESVLYELEVLPHLRLDLPLPSNRESFLLEVAAPARYRSWYFSPDLLRR